MTEFFIGDLRTGRRIQGLRALSGSWSDVLNDSGDLSCTVSLKDPVMQRLNLFESATPAKTFLAAFDGDNGLQAGPIWARDWDDDSGKLTLSARGMWSYFDHRALLPVLAGRLPSDPTTDTRYMPYAAPTADYPWPVSTVKSLQGIARALVVQARTWTGGDVPIVLPTEIAGTAERAYRGADVAMVGQRLRALTEVLGGPDIKFIPRWTADRLGVEWVMQIGSPTQPLIYAPQETIFYVGADKSSVTRLRVKDSGLDLGSQGFSSGGSSVDKALVAVSYDPMLVNAGFPLLDVVDNARSTVSEIATLQGYADELVLQGRKPQRTFAFTHNLSVQPYLGALNTGDFAKVRVTKNRFLPDSEYRMRLLARSGDAKGKDVDLTFAPAVS